MKLKLILFLSITSLISACSVKAVEKKPPQNAPSSDASIKLAEAANSVSRSLIELAKIEKESKPVKSKNLVNVNSYNLQARASIDWSGPIEELLSRLSKASYYRLRVLGNAPAIPVLISLNSHDEILADIFRNIDYLAGDKADIRIYPQTKIVELRYAKA
jgi:defect-in-organelle-trafficking protein DotD